MCVLELIEKKDQFVRDLRALKVQTMQQVDQKFEKLIEETVNRVNVSGHTLAHTSTQHNPIVMARAMTHWQSH